jgi:hypothetical protein
MKDEVKNILDKVYFQSEKLSKEKKIEKFTSETSESQKEKTKNVDSFEKKLNKNYFILLYVLIILSFILLLLILI